jgi:hypothetical protein
MTEAGLRDPRARVTSDVISVGVSQQMPIDVAPIPARRATTSTNRRIDCGDDGLDGTSRIST